VFSYRRDDGATRPSDAPTYLMNISPAGTGQPATEQ